MPAIFILGLVFAIGLFALYMFSTSNKVTDEKKTSPKKENLKNEENVIFLPTDIEREKEKHKKRK